jgi:hypothetical protein
MTRPLATVLPGGHSEWEPPDPFSNSEVNTLCADASVDFVDVKVGHCQALNSMQTGKPPTGNRRGFFFICPQQQTIVQPRQLLDRSRALVHCIASKRRFVSGTLRFVSVYARLGAAHSGTICTDGSSPRTSSYQKNPLWPVPTAQANAPRRFTRPLTQPNPTASIPRMTCGTCSLISLSIRLTASTDSYPGVSALRSHLQLSLPNVRPMA